MKGIRKGFILRLLCVAALITASVGGVSWVAHVMVMEDKAREIAEKYETFSQHNSLSCVVDVEIQPGEQQILVHLIASSTTDSCKGQINQLREAVVIDPYKLALKEHVSYK